jgi:hypothetical protein
MGMWYFTTSKLFLIGYSYSRNSVKVQEKTSYKKVEIQSDVFVTLAVSFTPSSLRDNGIASTEFGTIDIS